MFPQTYRFSPEFCTNRAAWPQNSVETLSQGFRAGASAGRMPMWGRHIPCGCTNMENNPWLDRVLSRTIKVLAANSQAEGMGASQRVEWLVRKTLHELGDRCHARRRRRLVGVPRIGRPGSTPGRLAGRSQTGCRSWHFRRGLRPGALTALGRSREKGAQRYRFDDPR